MINRAYDASLKRLRTIALITAAAGLLLASILVVVSVSSGSGLTGFFQSYLYAFLFWLGASLGCFFLLMLQHLAGGPWGAMIRRPLEAGTMVLPLMALLFIPLAFGIPSLYEWANPQAVAENSVIADKVAYLNVPFFIGRAALYFLIWVGGSVLYFNWSNQQDRGGNPRATGRLQQLSAPFIILYILTMTFAAIDWSMSLTPEWFSGIYGVIFMIGQAINAMSLIIIFVVLYGKHKPLADALNKTRLQDLGNFLMAFTMFWAYVSVSQLIIIWSNNIVETNTWYVTRLNGGWGAVATFLLVFHFFVPFLILFSRWVKRKGRALIWVAFWMLFMRLVDLFWIIVPSFNRSGVQLTLMDLALLVGFGGLWLAVFATFVMGRSPLPLHDPRLQGAPQHA